MKTYVLDASSVLRYTDNEPGAERIENLLVKASEGDVRLIISSVNWGEIVHVLYKKHGLDHARTIAGNLSSLPLEIVPVSASEAEGAAIFKKDFDVPYADAFAGSLALALSRGPKSEWATLVTADFDFKSVPINRLNVEYLPKK